MTPVIPALDGDGGGYASLVARAARKWPDRTALTFRDRNWTYLDFDRLVTQAALTFRENGVGVGDRVVLLMSNRPEYLIAQFALSRMGAVFVTPNPRWTDFELASVLANLSAAAAVAETRFAGVLGGIPALPIPELDSDDEPGHMDRVDHEPEREVYVPFSSGTTGPPKGVRHSEGSLRGSVAQLVEHLALGPTDRLQLALPLCHVFGATMSAAAIAVGAQMTLFERFDLQECLDHVERVGVTVLPIAGTVAYQLAELEDLHERSLESLRYFMWGGSAVPRELAETITARTGVGFLCSYGMTEVPAVAFNPVHNRTGWSLRSPGYPAAGTRWRFVDTGFGTPELEVNGPGVALGYLAGPENSWVGDGWFRTGDLALLDHDGRLLIVDRVKDMLKVSGFQVSPNEVEDIVKQFPGVKDCGVFGEKDPRSGERAVAVVVGDLDEDGLRSWVSDRLASYKRPQRYIFAATIPRSPAGKTLRSKLFEAHGEPGERA